jgi:hypothetical protein
MQMQTTNKSQRSHREESKTEYRDADPRLAEYEREARTLMLSVQADKGEQIA